MGWSALHQFRCHVELGPFLRKELRVAGEIASSRLLSITRPAERNISVDLSIEEVCPTQGWLSVWACLTQTLKRRRRLPTRRPPNS
jgi:hypothetical protein